MTGVAPTRRAEGGGKGGGGSEGGDGGIGGDGGVLGGVLGDAREYAAVMSSRRARLKRNSAMSRRKGAHEVKTCRGCRVADASSDCPSARSTLATNKKHPRSFRAYRTPQTQ